MTAPTTQRDGIVVENVSRRGFLRAIVGAGGLVLGVRLLPGCAADGDEGADVPALEPPSDATLAPHVFLAIDAAGTVTIVAHRSEMGTGIRTSLPMVVADELEADWRRVRIEQAVGDARYGSQNTDGSRSIRRFFGTMREAGATARRMLEQAAARRWGVDVAECRARLHEIVHEPSGRSLGFGELVEDASSLPVPAAEELSLKDPADWRYVGTDVPITDGPDIVAGRATFGMDVVLDGMKFASVERCPVVGGKVARLDATAALAVPGVERVVEPFTPPPGFQALGGVAVVADSTWAALEGRRALDVEWDPGPNGDYDSDAYQELLREAVRAPGKVVRDRGDVDAAMAGAARVVEAEYDCPHLAHASMEPPCAVALAADGACEAWAPTQNPQAAQAEVARALGLAPDAVTVHVTLLGGGFGRKSKPDFIVEAAKLSREVGAPVRVVWTREDDVRHDYYHSVSAVAMKAGLDEGGRPVAWLQRSAFPSIGSTFNPAARSAGAGELGLGFVDVPFDVPNLRCENGEARAHVRIGWLRSVCNVFHAFAVGSFADEVAAARGRDPVTSLLELLGPDRELDLAAEGVEYANYGEPVERYPVDTGRLRRVVELVAEQAGWGRSLPRGRGLGIAAHRSFLTYVATVVEVEVSPDGRLTIPRVDMVADCGLVVHPDRVRAQMEGSAVFGASLALSGEITAREGRIEQGNFDDYPVARMDAAPRRVEVRLLASDELPGGAGEPGVPPVAPALCNAIYAATGRRVRRLPLARHDLSWT